MSLDFSKKKAFLIPRVFTRRYGMIGEPENNIVANGKITIHISWVIVMLRGILRLLKVIPPYPGKEIPVNVTYSFEKSINAITVNRIFYFPQQRPIHFKSQMSFLQNSLMVETSQYHLGTSFSWEIKNNQLYFNYRSHVLKFRNWLIRLPIGLILGRCNAKEIALSDSFFSMEMKFTHPWFGTTYEYSGTFEIIEKGDSSDD